MTWPIGAISFILPVWRGWGVSLMAVSAACFVVRFVSTLVPYLVKGKISQEKLSQENEEDDTEETGAFSGSV